MDIFSRMVLELQASSSEAKPLSFNNFNITELNAMKSGVEDRMACHETEVVRLMRSLKKAKSVSEFDGLMEKIAFKAETAIKHHAVAQEIAAQIMFKLDHQLIRKLGNSAAGFEFAASFARSLEENIDQPPQASWAFLNGGAEELKKAHSQAVARRSLLSEIRLTPPDSESNVIEIDFRRCRLLRKNGYASSD